MQCKGMLDCVAVLQTHLLLRVCSSGHHAVNSNHSMMIESLGSEASYSKQCCLVMQTPDLSCCLLQLWLWAALVVAEH